MHFFLLGYVGTVKVMRTAINVWYESLTNVLER